MPSIEQARTWYKGADVVHDFEHVERVYRMAERLALAEGAGRPIGPQQFNLRFSG